MSNLDFKTPSRPLTWLITGCSSGLGLSLARNVLNSGDNLIATSRNPSRTPDLVAEVEAGGGRWLQLDVNSHDCGDVIKNLESEGVAVDVLVNNAGMCVFGALEQITDDEARSQLETLYLGPLRLVRAAVPGMRARKFGAVVNVSSGSALEARESMGAYAGGKAALDGMSKVLAKELAPFNIRVLTVQLGTFDTGMVSANVPLAKNPLPQEYQGSVADATIKWLLSGTAQANGDTDKAARAIFEVVAAREGMLGHGKESERVLPLGKDLVQRIELVRSTMAHTLEVFGGVAESVARGG